MGVNRICLRSIQTYAQVAASSHSGPILKFQSIPQTLQRANKQHKLLWLWKGSLTVTMTLFNGTLQSGSANRCGHVIIPSPWISSTDGGATCLSPAHLRNKSLSFSVADLSSAAMPTSLAECPAFGTTCIQWRNYRQSKLIDVAA